jgi:hypothetical protein
MVAGALNAAMASAVRVTRTAEARLRGTGT